MFARWSMLVLSFLTTFVTSQSSSATLYSCPTTDQFNTRWCSSASSGTTLRCYYADTQGSCTNTPYYCEYNNQNGQLTDGRYDTGIVDGQQVTICQPAAAQGPQQAYQQQQGGRFGKRSTAKTRDRKDVLKHVERAKRLARLAHRNDKRRLSFH